MTGVLSHNDLVEYARLAMPALEPCVRHDGLLAKINAAGFVLAAEGGFVLTAGGERKESPLLRAYARENPSDRAPTYVWRLDNTKGREIIFVSYSGNVDPITGKPPTFADPSQITLGVISNVSGSWPLRAVSYDDYTRRRGETARDIARRIEPEVSAAPTRSWPWKKTTQVVPTALVL